MQAYFRGRRSSLLYALVVTSPNGSRTAPGGGEGIILAGRSTTGAAGPGGAFSETAGACSETAADDDAPPLPLPAGGLPSCGGGPLSGGSTSIGSFPPDGIISPPGSSLGGGFLATLASPAHFALFPIDSSRPSLSRFWAPSGASVTRGGGGTSLGTAGDGGGRLFLFCARSATTCGSSPSGKPRLSV